MLLDLAGKTIAYNSLYQSMDSKRLAGFVTCQQRVGTHFFDSCIKQIGVSGNQSELRTKFSRPFGKNF
jgi:hypothetical protein